MAEHLEEAPFHPLVDLALGEQADALGEQPVAQALAHALLLLGKVGQVQGPGALVIVLGDFEEGLGVRAK